MALRAAGLMLIVTGSAMVRILPALAPGWRAIALAGLAFLGFSSGSALLVLGRHIDDPVRLGQRWTAWRMDRMDR